MSEFLKKLSELINAKNPAYQNNRQQITSEAINTSNKTGTSNAPESVAKPTTTPISANTQTNTTNNQAPKTTPISTPIPAPKTTPTNNAAKNTSVPPTAKNSSQVPIDPKSGAAGAKVFNEIMDSDPGVFVKKDKILTEVYNAGFYGMDITREIRDNARAGNYLEQIEAIYNAGKQDAKGKPTDDKTKKADDDFSTEAARKEKILWMQNTKQAQKSAESKSVPDDLSIEAARKEHISQKKLDNQEKVVYTSGNNTGDGDSNKQKYPSGSLEKQEQWEKDYQTAKSKYKNSPGKLLEPIPSGTYNKTRGAHGEDYGHDFKVGGDLGKGTPVYAVADGKATIKILTYKSEGETKYCSYGVYIKHEFKHNGQDCYVLYAHLSVEDMNKYYDLELKDLKNYLKSVSVSPEDIKSFNVKVGDIIGFVGSTGHSDGNHLHFVLRMKINDEWIYIDNPQQYFSGWGK